MDAADALQQKIRAAIPLGEAMQFGIDSLDLDRIAVSAPLLPNINIHGTAFAGSIYSIAVLTGWALCTHILEAMQVDAELVVARAEIRYRKPVTGALLCATETPVAERESFLRDIREHGKGLLRLHITVGDNSQALMDATFCAIANAARTRELNAVPRSG